MIPYSQFLTYLSQSQIDEVAVGTDRVEGKLKQAPQGKPPGFVAVRVEDPDLSKKLAQAGVRFSGLRESTFFRDLLSWVIPVLVLVALWRYMLGRSGGLASGSPLTMGKSKAKVFVEKELKTRFVDVAGVDEAKEDLEEIVQFLKDPAHFTRLGGRMPKGVLLIGPPGTGKTLLARAVAGEAGVPFFSINGSEFVELFVGLGAARVRDLFEQARAQAPCIIFIDELDALGKARGLAAITGSANDEKEQTLNQLLAELDGFDPSRGIVLLAATNRPEVLDPALLRAGRFDRQIMVDKPDRRGRLQILSVHMRGVKVDPGFDPDQLAALTAGFSGADLANLINEAALIATRRGASEVQLADFTQAIERIVGGLERKNRLLNPEEKKRVAYHEMGHATLGLALDASDIIHKVSVIPRGISALGYTIRRPTEDRYLMSKLELETKMAVALGGRASEEIFFSEISTGAADDLDKATEIARAMITRYGMSPKLGLATFEKDPSVFLGIQGPVQSHSYSEGTASEIDSEIKNLLDSAMQASLRVIRNNRAFIEECATLLLSKETLDEAELKKIWVKHKTTPQSFSQAV